MRGHSPIRIQAASRRAQFRPGAPFLHVSIPCVRARVFTLSIMMTGAKNQLLNINGPIRLIKVRRESTP